MLDMWYFIKAPVASAAARSEAEIPLLLITTQNGAYSNLMQTQTFRARDGNAFFSDCMYYSLMFSHILTSIIVSEYLYIF